MNSNHHRFTIGSLDCMVVTDGTYNYPNPGQLLFANASSDELAPVLQAHNLEPAAWNVYVSPYPSLLIEHDDQRILVDMGAGKLAPTTGKLVINLRAAGIAPEEIDLVFITHAHPDHIGGALAEDGRPVFSNARYLLGRAEWDFWAADPD
ncbi:MAG: MBL fold metallo-hydrolase, partial [Caldilineaceae bacterium]|nr:MBL fold metallo-hydrolase [Caldilineaceae bacterium]